MNEIPKRFNNYNYVNESLNLTEIVNYWILNYIEITIELWMIKKFINEIFLNNNLLFILKIIYWFFDIKPKSL